MKILLLVVLIVLALVFVLLGALAIYILWPFVEARKMQKTMLSNYNAINKQITRINTEMETLINLIKKL